MSDKVVDQFCVFLYDKVIGRLYRKDDVTRFVFEENYWEDPERSILGLRFEEDRFAPHKFRMRLPSWFSNLLPEGQLRQWIAEARGASVHREMELLAQVGHDLPGAVRVLTSEQHKPIGELGDDVPKSKELSPNKSLWTFSLAGVGLKFSMRAKGERLTIPGAGEGGDWIIKLPEPMYQDVPRVEAAMMTLARLCGIDVPEIRLIHRDLVEELPDGVWPRGENLAYAIRRFDRTPDQQMVHIEDFAQVRGFFPEKKYSGSYETVAALIYRNYDIISLQEFSRRLIFNIVIGNGDAHLKNWSLIYRDRRRPTLSPAYDLVPTFLYRPKEINSEAMALRFGYSNRFEDVRLSFFGNLESKLGVKAELEAIARDLVDKMPMAWEEVQPMLSELPELHRRIDEFLVASLKRLKR
jgi:serine/threonine-protein kinase HipA